MTIKAVIFDMDDTLYDEKQFIKSGFVVLDNHIKQKYSIDGFYNIANELFDKGERKLIFNKTLETLKIPYDNKIIQFLVSVYRSHKPNIELFEDAKWVLKNLSKDIKVGLISDGYLEAQQNKVKALKLDKRCDLITLSDYFGRENWKPSKIPYEHTSTNLDVLPHECVYIGDNISKDFVTAKKLGWKTVHIDRRNGIYSDVFADEDYCAHFKITDLRSLINITEMDHLFSKKFSP